VTTQSQALTPTITVRPLYPADQAILQQVCWPNRAPDGVRRLLNHALGLAVKRRGLGVVSVRDDLVCGFGMLSLWPRTAEISDLIVTPALRGQGIGSRIVAYLTQAARNLCADTIEIGAAESNPRALELYRRLDFADDRVIQVDLGNGPEPVIYLNKPLPPLRPF
jgi:ribosomal protein S18 acetylase RimI-like enzyme